MNIQILLDNLITVLVVATISVPILISLFVYLGKRKDKRKEVLGIIGRVRYNLNHEDILSDIKKKGLLKELNKIRIECVEGRNDRNIPIWVVRAKCGKDISVLEHFPLTSKENAIRSALSIRNSLQKLTTEANNIIEARKFKSSNPLDLDQEELLLKLKQ